MAQPAQGENGKEISQQLLRARPDGGCGGLLGEPAKRRSRFCLCVAYRKTPSPQLGYFCFPGSRVLLVGEGHAGTSCVSVGTGVGCWNRHSPADTAHF